MRRLSLLSVIYVCGALFAGGEGVCEDMASALSCGGFVCRDYSPVGSWQVYAPSGGGGPEEMRSRIFLAASDLSAGIFPKKSYGGAFNLKYFSGLDYNYLRKKLPGRTVSFDVSIPKESTVGGKEMSGRLRVCIKSERDGRWAEYCGGERWERIAGEGTHTFTFRIPEKPSMDAGGNIFFPENLILISVEYFAPERISDWRNTYFLISNFSIEGIRLDEGLIRWQFLKDGYVDVNTFLPSFTAGSVLIASVKGRAELRRRDFNMALAEKEFAQNLKDTFIDIDTFISRGMRSGKGRIVLRVVKNGNTLIHTAKRLDSADMEGRIRLTLPLDELHGQDNSSSTIGIAIETPAPPERQLAPFILESVKIKKARLIPFDKKWTVRDVQGLGAYRRINVREDGVITDSGVTVVELKDNSYHMTATVRLKGGIDWKNPLYRVEFMREMEEGPVDMEDMRVEVAVRPLDDTMEFWQRPYRARIGLLDMNGRVMLGPNISLSEGLSGTAYLDVSTRQPIPKGFVMPGFDPGKVKALIINLEAPPVHLKPRDIRISFENLVVSVRGREDAAAILNIDFSTFRRNPESWQITRIIKDAGGYAVGVNYPFPVVDVGPEILEVPQVYPTVGRKSTDPIHLGFSSGPAREAILRDFKELAVNGVRIVRVFTFGHLEGVFNWDETGRTITGFAGGVEDLLRKASGMKVEDMAKFLNENEDRIFRKTAGGAIIGLEAHVMKDFLALLDELEETERATGRRLTAMVSLYDFLLGDDIRREGPMRRFEVGEHQEVVTDPLTKVKALALTWKIMKTLSRDERFYKYVCAVEIMNEPDNATALSTAKHFNDLVNFVGEGLYLVKDAVGESMPVTVGFRSSKDDLRHWVSVGEGIDMLTPHYWESFESYNIDSPGLWPLDTPAEEIWKCLGTERKGRLTGMCEISPLGDLAGNISRLRKAGYDFVLPWSYSGHDGHDIKPFMHIIRGYTKKR